MKSCIARIEGYVREAMDAATDPDLRLAHGYSHVDRVRNWGLRIAEEEGYDRLLLVEAAALLHDIGLAHLSAGAPRAEHGTVGGEVAARFLVAQDAFSAADRAAIVDAVRCHNALGCGGDLASMVRDADMLDALGAVGVMRALVSKYAQQEYDPEDVKGATWGLTARDYDRRFAAGKGIGGTIVDQINFQISFAGNLSTEAARRAADPLVAYMRGFVRELAYEVAAARR
jgi:HD superfamily phosphodiesterase